MPQLHAFGDSAIRIVFGEEVNQETARQIREFGEKLQAIPIKGVTEWIPSFTAMTVIYDPLQVTYEEIIAALGALLDKEAQAETLVQKVYHVPVCYEGEYGVDLEEVAKQQGLTVEEVIAIHTAKDYYIHMIGFMPGFPYLGGLDSRLHTPRRATPRKKVAAGTVGIGGEQTGIYPLDAPGGWQLIGKTPLRIFHPGRRKALLWKAGDFIRFYAVTREEFTILEEEIKNGTYEMEVTEKGGDESETD